MKIREAVASDVSAIVALAEDYCAKTGDVIDYHWFMQWLCYSLATDSFGFVVDDNGEIVGGMLASLQLSSVEQKCAVWKQWFYVKDLPKAGLYAKALMGALISWATQKGCTEIIYAHEHARAKGERTEAFLKALGYAETGKLYSKKI